MGLFRKKAKKGLASSADTAALAQRSLDFITEAVLVVDMRGMIKFANPAAAAMTGYGDAANVTGLDFQLVIHLENHQEVPIEPDQSTLFTAVRLNQALNTRDYVLVSAQSERRYSIDLACIPTGDERADRLITFRDITTELAEEREQAEFISTASHEMRTPVASIEGYLGLSLNPQTATIDDRARKYLEAAHAASQHLGRLFKDLLDVTKLDDSRANIHLIPVDAVEAVSYIANEQAEAMQAKNLRYTFGGTSKFLDKKHLSQKIYMAVDYDFLREIINNLVGNAIKYTPEGGEIKVNVKGEADKVLITVTDTGIGIPSDDLSHIFQKFYRVDSTQTREIGGTGLGLYLVKQRVEALGGRVWVESDFGHGSTFSVTLPRISESEYEKRRIAYGNEKMMRTPFVAPVVGNATLKVPAIGITRTATGKTGATIKPGGASLNAAGSQAVANSSSPASVAPSTAPNITMQASATTTPATPQASTTNVTTPAKPTISPMIKAHPISTPPALEEPAVEASTTATPEEPQIFASHARTLQPIGIPKPSPAPNTQPLTTPASAAPGASNIQPSAGPAATTPTSTINQQ